MNPRLRCIRGFEISEFGRPYLRVVERIVTTARLLCGAVLPRQHVLAAVAVALLRDGDDAMLTLVDDKHNVARRVVRAPGRVQKGECVVGGGRDAKFGNDCEQKSEEGAIRRESTKRNGCTNVNVCNGKLRRT